MNITLWTITGLLALAFLAAGARKITQPKAKLASAGQPWTEDFTAPSVKASAHSKVLGALGLILPALLGTATVLVPVSAAALAALMIGAATFMPAAVKPQHHRQRHPGSPGDHSSHTPVRALRSLKDRPHTERQMTSVIMSNLETVPDEIICTEGAGTNEVEFLVPREVPLGGPRAMPIRRTLPQKQRSLIGSWCFLDHYGPDLVPESGGMRVPRHPHTGLATVSWLFTGKIAHRDSAGYEAIVRPGEVNLMIAGRGISHQEFSTPDTGILHGAQLWYALPDATRNMPPAFEHYAPEPVSGDGTELRVFIGSLAGNSSPLATRTPPLLGAEAVLNAGARLELNLNPFFEQGILLDTGEISLDGRTMALDHLHYIAPGRTNIVLQAGQTPARVLILGGEPLGEQIVMWWNFVGRSHEDIVTYRSAWQAEIGAEPAGPPADDTYPDGTPYPRFGTFPEGYPAPLPAPELPNVQLRPRG